ncbi:MAG TPA: hypothetical protein PLX33_01610 [Alphaproteobacteria bacterium]|nr:hypothetical protein [Alphaproteobacteria bacterium]
MAEEKKKIEIKEKENNNPDIILIEPIESLFIDGFQGVSMNNGIVRINLHEDKYDPTTEKVSRHIVKRLCIPIASFISFVDTLDEIKKSLPIEIHSKNKEN